MSWRTVIIANRCKLDLKLGYLVVRGEETRRIFLDEIAVLLIEDPALSAEKRLYHAAEIGLLPHAHHPYGGKGSHGGDPKKPSPGGDGTDAFGDGKAVFPDGVSGRRVLQ